MSELPINGNALLSEKRRYLQRQLMVERQKLERLITTQYEKGVVNLGSDIEVLKQSSVLDKLLVDMMLLDIDGIKC